MIYSKRNLTKVALLAKTTYIYMREVRFLNLFTSYRPGVVVAKKQPLEVICGNVHMFEPKYLIADK